MAIEILLTMAESRSGMMRKIPNFAPAIVDIAFNMMLTVEDIPLDEWNRTEVSY